jgi:EmrB/QacA subfamily drug resistance transporter
VSGAATETAGLRYGEAGGRWVLLATVLASGMAFLDATVVAVALPAIGADLDAGMAGLQWTVNAYTLTLAALILLGGSAGDRFGRRRVFLVGVVWFAAASLLCGLAPTVELLVVARALQGVGGALLTPGSLAILQASFHPEHRARVIGAWSGLAGIASAAGPFVGGWLVEAVSWRWVFLLNLPLAAVVVAVTVRHVPESRDPAADPGFDVAGAALGAASLAALTWGLVTWGEAGAGPAAAGLVAAGVGLAVAFVVTERRRPAPMLPLTVFESSLFRAANAVTFLVYAALGGVFFLLVITLQVVAGFGAVAAGAALLPVTVLMLLLSARAGALAERIGPRLPMTVGPLVAAVGVALLAGVDPTTTYLTGVLPGMTLLGLGLSATVAPLTATVLAAAPERHAGLASGVNNAVARTAGLLAVAALPAVVGLSGTAYADAAALEPAHAAAMWWCAGLLAAGGLLSAVLVREPAAEVEVGPCRTHCAVGAPPLQPEELG